MTEPDPTPLAPPGSLFARLTAACAEDWTAYTRHAFVRGLAEGSLAEASFRHYLAQDYVFLIHLARAYALAAYKADTLAGIRAAAAAVSAIVDTEMRLHVGLCARWGLDAAALERTPEAAATMAYTRYVLERGQAGDLLDLHVALAPCVIGYAEIGARLAAEQRDASANPYREWIATYAGEDYQRLAREAAATLDRLEAARAGPGRFDGLVRTFREATRLEARFWDMGLQQSW